MGKSHPANVSLGKGKTCVNNMISFCERETHLVDVDVSIWTLVKSLTTFPTASLWRNWLCMAWTGALVGKNVAGARCYNNITVFSEYSL